MASAPAGFRALERLPELGGIPIFDPAFGEGATVEKMRREGVRAGGGAACFFFFFSLSWGCGGRFSVMMVRIFVADAV